MICSFIALLSLVFYNLVPKIVFGPLDTSDPYAVRKRVHFSMFVYL